MIPIKIQCGCGQKYAFEIEPVGGRMPATIACPVCGTDGTDAANQAIALSLPAAPPPAPAPPPSAAVRVTAPRASAPAPTRTPPRGVPGINLEQAKHEARAKVIWGDPTNSVISFLMVQGYKREEATEIVQEFYRERLAAVRAKGMKSIMLGLLCLAVPGGTWLTFWHLGVTSSTLIAITSVVGVLGLYLFFNGFLQLVASKKEQGNAAE